LPSSGTCKGMSMSKIEVHEWELHHLCKLSHHLQLRLKMTSGMLQVIRTVCGEAAAKLESISDNLESMENHIAALSQESVKTADQTPSPSTLAGSTQSGAPSERDTSTAGTSDRPSASASKNSTPAAAAAAPS